MAYDRLHGEEPKQRKKPQSQIEAEERREVDNKKKKFQEFVAVMMAKGKKSKTQSWNESFNDFVPTDITKSRRERKKEERLRKEQKDQELQEKKALEEADAKPVTTKEVIKTENGVTIVQKEINKKSTKLGSQRSKQVHIKFDENADIDAALEKIEEHIPAENDAEMADADKEKQEEEDEEIDENRLYIMNLPFKIAEEELRTYFGRYGEIDEISIPLRKGGIGTGFAFVRFMEPEAAVNAYANLDKKIFQGRILTILPASKKKEKPKTEEEVEKNDESKDPQDHREPKVNKESAKVDEKSSFKTKKKTHLKRNFDDETNWNYLFVNQDAVTEVVANKLSLKKGDILSKDDDNLAVRVANIETQIIKETKEWMVENGMDIKAIEGKDNRKECKRSKTMILIKNISPKVTLDELSLYAQTTDVIISPSNTLAIAKYKSASQAEAVMKKLCYYRLHNIPLYLEYAPQVFETAKLSPAQVAADTYEDSEPVVPNTVFVKNLNFDTSEQKLKELFEGVKAGKILSAKIVRNKQDGLQSKGYGFIEFETEEAAKTAIKKLQNTVLDDHMLKLKLSKKDTGNKRQAKANRKEKQAEDFVDDEDMASTKLLIKNLAFEATKKDIQSLFKEAGQIKRVRLPKKANSHTHRGFGFVEFVTVEDAKNAFETMQHSHLYGRKLVIQWAKKTDDVNDINELRQKAEYQQTTRHQVAEANKRQKFDEKAEEQEED